MKTLKILALSALLFVVHAPALYAAVVDTVDTYSAVMQKTLKAVVIRPDHYDRLEALPVVYLLHGYSGTYSDWIKKAAGFEKAADYHQMIIVCPDGGYGSWYWDSPADPAFQYETYIARELVAWVDAHYKTIKSSKGRAITGLSMGGHGALYLAIKHQDIFGAAGSMSGGVDIRPFPHNWDMAKRLGSYAENPGIWETHTVLNLLHLIPPKSLKLIIDCGVGDFFYHVNEALHQQLRYRNIEHDYITRPGAHNWSYWQQAVPYQLLFFSNYFREAQ